MWKESYRTGIEKIDHQHKMLFQKSGELIQAIERDAGPFAVGEIIQFLKNYVVIHFRDEEKYMQKVGYRDYEAHKMAHEAFPAVVGEYDRKLTEEGYDLAVVKDLAGTLTAWLIYHVAHADLRMGQGRRMADEVGERSKVQMVTDALENTLEAVAGLDREGLRTLDAAPAGFSDGVQVGVDLFGELSGTLIYTYSPEVAAGLFGKMTGMNAALPDEMVVSAMAEVANISSGAATIQFSQSGIACDIKPPRVDKPDRDIGFDGVIFDTGVGLLKVSAQLDRY